MFIHLEVLPHIAIIFHTLSRPDGMAKPIVPFLTKSAKGRLLLSHTLSIEIHHGTVLSYICTHSAGLARLHQERVVKVTCARYKIFWANIANAWLPIGNTLWAYL